jgi:hypothetical protein
MPGPYAAPIQFEATDTYTDESDGPEISDNLLQRHPADIDPRLNSRDSLQLVGAPSKSSSAASSSSKSANFRSARGSSSVSSASASRPPLASTSATPAALASSNSSSSVPQASPAAVATVPLRRRSQGIRDSLGFAIPFIAFAFWIGGAKALVRHAELLMKIGGVVMVLVGALLYFDQLSQMTNWLNAHTPDWLKW